MQTEGGARRKPRSQKFTKHQLAQRDIADIEAPNPAPTHSTHRRQHERGHQTHFSITLFRLVFCTLLSLISSYPTSLHKNYPNYNASPNHPPSPHDTHPLPRLAAATPQIWSCGRSSGLNHQGWNRHEWSRHGRSLRAQPPPQAQHDNTYTTTSKPTSKMAPATQRYIQTLLSNTLNYNTTQQPTQPCTYNAFTQYRDTKCLSKAHRIASYRRSIPPTPKRAPQQQTHTLEVDRPPTIASEAPTGHCERLVRLKTTPAPPTSLKHQNRSPHA